MDRYDDRVFTVRCRKLPETALLTPDRLRAVLANPADREALKSLREMRKEMPKERWREVFAALPSFQPCGVFRGRDRELPERYTQFVVLTTKRLGPFMVLAAYYALGKLPYSLLVWTSLIGDRVHVLVRVTSALADHAEAFDQVLDWYEERTSLEFIDHGDAPHHGFVLTGGREVAAMPEAKPFVVDTRPPHRRRAVPPEIVERVERIVARIEARKADVCRTRADWFGIGFALAEGMGAEGREYFRRISRMSLLFADEDHDRIYDLCYRGKGAKTTLADFFERMAEFGGEEVPEDELREDQCQPDETVREGEPEPEPEVAAPDAVEVTARERETDRRPAASPVEAGRTTGTGARVPGLRGRRCSPSRKPRPRPAFRPRGRAGTVPHEAAASLNAFALVPRPRVAMLACVPFPVPAQLARPPTHKNREAAP